MTATNNLDLQQVAENQAAPETTVNDATLGLGMALTEHFDVDVTSGNVTVSRADYQRAMLFNVHGASVARNVTLGTDVPKRGLALFQCAAANAANVSLICGATTATLKPGHAYAVATDGTVDGLVAIDIGNVSGEANDLSIFAPGILDDGQLIYRRKATRPFTIPVSMTGSYVTANVASTASCVITFKKNGSSIGTATFGVAGTVAVLVFASAVSFAAGDVFTIEGPATADVALADISFDLYASR